MNANIGLTAADGWNHDGYRAEPKRGVKGGLLGLSPIYIHRAGYWFNCDPRGSDELR